MQDEVQNANGKIGYCRSRGNLCALNEIEQATTSKFQMNRKQIVLDTPVWVMSFLLCKYKD